MKFFVNLGFLALTASGIHPGMPPNACEYSPLPTDIREGFSNKNNPNFRGPHVQIASIYGFPCPHMASPGTIVVDIKFAIEHHSIVTLFLSLDPTSHAQIQGEILNSSGIVGRTESIVGSSGLASRAFLQLSMEPESSARLTLKLLQKADALSNAPHPGIHLSCVPIRVDWTIIADEDASQWFKPSTCEAMDLAKLDSPVPPLGLPPKIYTMNLVALHDPPSFLSKFTNVAFVQELSFSEAGVFEAVLGYPRSFGASMLLLEVAPRDQMFAKVPLCNEEKVFCFSGSPFVNGETILHDVVGSEHAKYKLWVLSVAHSCLQFTFSVRVDSNRDHQQLPMPSQMQFCRGKALPRRLQGQFRIRDWFALVHGTFPFVTLPIQIQESSFFRAASPFDSKLQITVVQDGKTLDCSQGCDLAGGSVDLVIDATNLFVDEDDITGFSCREIYLEIDLLASRELPPSCSETFPPNRITMATSQDFVPYMASARSGKLFEVKVSRDKSPFAFVRLGVIVDRLYGNVVLTAVDGTGRLIFQGWEGRIGVVHNDFTIIAEMSSRVSGCVPYAFQIYFEELKNSCEAPPFPSVLYVIPEVPAEHEYVLPSTDVKKLKVKFLSPSSSPYDVKAELKSMSPDVEVRWESTSRQHVFMASVQNEGDLGIISNVHPEGEVQLCATVRVWALASQRKQTRLVNSNQLLLPPTIAKSMKLSGSLQAGLGTSSLQGSTIEVVEMASLHIELFLVNPIIPVFMELWDSNLKTVVATNFYNGHAMILSRPALGSGSYRLMLKPSFELEAGETSSKGWESLAFCTVLLNVHQSGVRRELLSTPSLTHPITVSLLSLFHSVLWGAEEGIATFLLDFGSQGNHESHIFGLVDEQYIGRIYYEPIDFNNHLLLIFVGESAMGPS